MPDTKAATSVTPAPSSEEISIGAIDGANTGTVPPAAENAASPAAAFLRRLKEDWPGCEDHVQLIFDACAAGAAVCAVTAAVNQIGVLSDDRMRVWVAKFTEVLCSGLSDSEQIQFAKNAMDTAKRLQKKRPFEAEERATSATPQGGYPQPATGDAAAQPRPTAPPPDAPKAWATSAAPQGWSPQPTTGGATAQPRPKPPPPKLPHRLPTRAD